MVLTYANDHPSDSDVPESLYLVLRMIRYGCDASQYGNDASAKENEQKDDLKKAAARLLRQRYAASPWTKKAAPIVE